MNIHVRVLASLFRDIHDDLSRAHRFAMERVGFLSCASARLSGDDVVLIGRQWHRVTDEDYIDNPEVGACIGPAAFRKILAVAHRTPLSILHVHRHEHWGSPGFSLIDAKSMREFIPGFFNACPSRAHGALVLSRDSAAGAIWLDRQSPPVDVHRFEIVGQPSRFWRVT